MTKKEFCQTEENNDVKKGKEANKWVTVRSKKEIDIVRVTVKKGIDEI